MTKCPFPGDASQVDEISIGGRLRPLIIRVHALMLLRTYTGSLSTVASSAVICVISRT